MQSPHYKCQCNICKRLTPCKTYFNEQIVIFHDKLPKKAIGICPEHLTEKENVDYYILFNSPSCWHDPILQEYDEITVPMWVLRKLWDEGNNIIT